VVRLGLTFPLGAIPFPVLLLPFTELVLMVRSLPFLPLDSEESLGWVDPSSAGVGHLTLALGRKVSCDLAGCNYSPFLFSPFMTWGDVDRSADVPFGFLV